jgi:hypothetical protein
MKIALELRSQYFLQQSLALANQYGAFGRTPIIC